MEGYENWEENPVGEDHGNQKEDAAENPAYFQKQADFYFDGQSQQDACDENQNFYGDENGWYRPVSEQDLKKKTGSGFFGKLVKCVILGVAFGAVASAAFMGTSKFFGTYTGSLEPDLKDTMSGADLSIASETEEADLASYGSDGKKGDAAGGTITDVSGIVEEAMPSIVSITTIVKAQMPGFFFGQMQEYESEGCSSGIIVSQDEENLYIVTNNHVVQNAQTLKVLFADGSDASAQIKGTDASSDLAVVHVALGDIEEKTKSKIRTATFGDSSALKAGQAAIAIGNALGYGQSVTTGVISAVDREVTVDGETDAGTITNELVQTDAAINPGNSGGALLNLRGEVVGINSAKYSETSVEGMGYAIPSKMAIPIIKQLITREAVSPSKTPYLGISGVDVTERVADRYQVPKGVYVASVVEGSGAANAGLIQGDIISRFDGRNVKSMEEIQELMKYLEAGTAVEITVWRAQDGEYKEQVYDVVLGGKK